MSFDLIIQHSLEFAILIPACFYAFIPVRDQVRSKTVYLAVAIVVLISCVAGACICTSYDLSTNQVLIPVSPVYLIAYIYMVKTPLFPKLFCFGNAVMLTTFCTMYTNYLTAKIEMGREDQPFSVASSLICLGINLIILLIYFRALAVWIPFFISDELLTRAWKWLCLATVFMTVLFFWITPLRATNVVYKRTQQIGIVLITFIPVILWAIYYVSWWIARKNREYTEAMNEKFMLYTESKRFERFREYFMETQALRHDFRQQMLVLKRYVEEDDFESLKSHILEYSSHMKESPERLCENYPIDAVVSYYKDLAEQKDIRLNAILQLSRELPWEDTGLCTIFGNLLENAVRATSEVTNRDKEITLVSKQISGGMMGISVKNPYEGEIIFGKDGLPKAKLRNHGVGLHSVNMTVKRMHGVMTVQAEDGEFSVDILLNANK